MHGEVVPGGPSGGARGRALSAASDWYGITAGRFTVMEAQGPRSEGEPRSATADQEPVGGAITVNRHRVLPEDRQLLIAIVHQPPPQQPWIDAEVLPPEAALDRDLPEASDIEHEDIVFLFQ